MKRLILYINKLDISNTKNRSLMMNPSRYIIMLLLSTQLFSQNNHIYGELLGPGLMASINYERNLDNNIAPQ